MDPDDDWGIAVVATVGRQLRLRREAKGMRAGEFGEGLVHKIEGGRRIPRPEYLDMADLVLDAGGLVSAMKEDVRRVRYPKRVRDLARSEAQAGTESLGALGTVDTPGAFTAPGVSDVLGVPDALGPAGCAGFTADAFVPTDSPDNPFPGGR